MSNINPCNLFYMVMYKCLYRKKSCLSYNIHLSKQRKQKSRSFECKKL